MFSMSLRRLLSAAVDLVRAAVCPAPGLGCPVPVQTRSMLATFARPVRLGAHDEHTAHGTGCPGPARHARPVDGCAPRAPRARVLTHVMPAGAPHDARAWRASPRARLGGTDAYTGREGVDYVPRPAHVQTVGADSTLPSPVYASAPTHTPRVERTPDPITVTNAGAGVPGVDLLHERASRADAARFPRVNVDAHPDRPLTLRANVVLPYDRPLAILRITDDTRVEMSGRTLVGAEHFHFVIDSWAYDDGEIDVILTCERTHKRAAQWIDTHGRYAK